MSDSRRRRVAALEAALAPRRPPFNPVVTVRPGETRGEAVDRHMTPQCGHLPRGLRLLIVPAVIRTDAEEAEFAVRFKAQQMALVEWAKSRRVAAETANPEPVLPKVGGYWWEHGQQWSAAERRHVPGKLLPYHPDERNPE